MRDRTARAGRLLALVLFLSACANDITTQEFQSGVVVATQRLEGVDFAAFRSFAIVTRVGVVSDDAAAPVSQVAAPALIARVAEQLEARGFRRVADVDPAAPLGTPVIADLAVNLTALDSDRIDPPYWSTSPSHSKPTAWGYTGYAWAYSWPWAPVVLRRGTVLLEIADLGPALASPASSGSLPVIWAALAYGVAPAETGLDSDQVVEALARAIPQSPYLRAVP